MPLCEKNPFLNCHMEMDRDIAIVITVDIKQIASIRTMNCLLSNKDLLIVVWTSLQWTLCVFNGSMVMLIAT